MPSKSAPSLRFMRLGSVASVRWPHLFTSNGLSSPTVVRLTSVEFRGTMRRGKTYRPSVRRQPHAPESKVCKWEVSLISLSFPSFPPAQLPREDVMRPRAGARVEPSDGTCPGQSILVNCGTGTAGLRRENPTPMLLPATCKREPVHSRCPIALLCTAPASLTLGSFAGITATC